MVAREQDRVDEVYRDIRETRDLLEEKLTKQVERWADLNRHITKIDLRPTLNGVAMSAMDGDKTLYVVCIEDIKRPENRAERSLSSFVMTGGFTLPVFLEKRWGDPWIVHLINKLNLKLRTQRCPGLEDALKTVENYEQLCFVCTQWAHEKMTISRKVTGNSTLFFVPEQKEMYVEFQGDQVTVLLKSDDTPVMQFPLSEALSKDRALRYEEGLLNQGGGI